jgi:two-component system, response regulator YesN
MPAPYFGRRIDKMFNLLIVEDEKIIREGFARVIDEFEDFQVTAVRSGEEALELLETGSFDAMLLDIKLPGMSGLDVLDYVRDQGLQDVLTIIVSGFNDFDYARRAVDMHVFEYILKPVTPSRIREIVEKLREALKAHKQQELNVQLMEEKIDRARPILKQSLFGDILSESQTEQELLERAKFLDTDLQADRYRVVLVKPEKGSPGEGEGDGDGDGDGREFFRQATNQKIYEIIVEFPWLEPVEAFFLTTYSFALIQMGKSGESACPEDYALLKKLFYKIHRETGIAVLIGIGNWVETLSEVRESYKQASFALVHSSATSTAGSGPCRYYREAIKSGLETVPDFKESGEISFAFINLDGDSLKHMISEKLARSLSENSLESISFIVMYLHVVLSVVGEYAHFDAEGVRKRVTEIFSLIHQHAAYAYPEALYTLTDQVLDGIRNERSLMNNDLVQKLKKYIYAQYDQDICISGLAQELGYSPNHVGAAFKKETGQTIHDFWHTVRIEKAKTLLKKKNLLISEAAVRVGYNDQYYFSNVFKRYTGVSPKTYRNS